MNAAQQSPLVHLVDDDAGVRDALARLIASVGLRVQPWDDPQAFLDRFAAASTFASKARSHLLSPLLTYFAEQTLNTYSWC